METNIKTISVCIPTYEMDGKGSDFIKRNFEILINQSFKDFDVVISDNANDDSIKKICDMYEDQLDIHYFKNEDPKKGMSSNVNNSIKKATGKIIKILFLDDFLYNDDSLNLIAQNFDLKYDDWIVTDCIHTKDGKKFYNYHRTHYNDKIHLGKNTIGCPSVLSIKNNNPLLFDNDLKWLMDCDYYKRCYQEFGSPKIINKLGVVIGTGRHQMTFLLNDSVKKSEYIKIKNKYENEKKNNVHLNNVTLVSVSGIDPAGSLDALKKSMIGIKYYDVVLISHKKPENMPENITFKQCKPTDLTSKDPANKNDYSKFMAYNLGDYINSDYCLIVHNDAYVLRPHKWDNAFLKYDYIGAPWPKRLNFFTDEGELVRVGNGGFSLRSKRMLNILNELNLPFTDNGTGFYNEDGILCVYYRKILEDAGIRFAPVELAAKFSHEIDCKESVRESFGYHDSKIVFPENLWWIKSILKKFGIKL